MIDLLILVLFVIGAGFLGRWIILTIFDAIFKPEKPSELHIHYHQSTYNQSLTVDKTTITNKVVTDWERLDN